MKIQVRTQGFEITPPLQEAALHHFRFALRRHINQVSSLDLFLKDTNGPRGGIDKSVLANVRLLTGIEVTVEDTREDLYQALSRCAARTRKAVRRSLNKARQRHPERLRRMRRNMELTDGITPV